MKKNSISVKSQKRLSWDNISCTTDQKERERVAMWMGNWKRGSLGRRRKGQNRDWDRGALQFKRWRGEVLRGVRLRFCKQYPTPYFLSKAKLLEHIIKAGCLPFFNSFFNSALPGFVHKNLLKLLLLMFPIIFTLSNPMINILPSSYFIS